MAAKVHNFDSIRFPEVGLGSDEIPNYIRFVPSVVDYAGVTVQNAIAMPAMIQSAANQVETALDSAAATVNRDWSFGVRGNTTVSQRATRNQTLNDGVSFGNDRIFSQGSIHLFMPENIQSHSSVNYAETEMGATGKTVVDGLAKDGATGKDLVENAGSLLPALIQDFASISERQRGAVAMTRGVVSNNYSYQIFNGVNHRSYDYSFKLVAKNSRDSAIIKYLCDTFLYYMLPARNTADFHFYEIPAQWAIEYFRKGESMEYYQQPKPCFLQNVNVTYGGARAGNTTFSDGAPMDVTLDLAFVEIEPLYRTE